MIYRTRRGDVLDLICRNHYAGAPYSVEAVYDANPGLAAHGPVLPSGLLIDLPPPLPAEPATIRLWD